MFSRRVGSTVKPQTPKRQRQKKSTLVPKARRRAESIADLVTKMKAGESNLLVVSRIRPLSRAETLRGATEIAKVVGDKVVVLLDPAADTEDVLRKNRSREKRYAFDHAFGPGSTQLEVYETSCKFLLRGVLEGYNATVFAYGPTGAGKTFTMSGTEEDPGIMTRSISDLFRLMEEDAAEVDYDVAVNYVEIYNETIRDLLVPGSPDLELRETGDGNAVVCGVRWVDITTAGQLAKLLLEGNLRRTQEATLANQASSRSHSILEVRVRRQSKTAGKEQTVQTGRLHMIDLAGSERAASTGNHGQRMVEGQHINRSLLALGNCINALGTGNKSFVNFRDSKLTRILKESLGGNCRTVMIACGSPASVHFEETYNTMNYANRAKNIKTAAVKNTTVVEAHVVEFGKIIDKLRSEVAMLRAQLKESQDSEPDAQPSTRPTQSARRSLNEISRRYGELYKLDERLEGYTVEEVRLELAGTSPLPGERSLRDLAAARALLLEEIEAEKAAIARLTAAAEASPMASPSHAAELRHLADAHALRKANLELSTHLRVAKMRLTEAERIAARTIRDRIIERQRALLDSVLGETPDDLSAMYDELARELARSPMPWDHRGLDRDPLRAGARDDNDSDDGDDDGDDGAGPDDGGNASDAGAGAAAAAAYGGGARRAGKEGETNTSSSPTWTKSKTARDDNYDDDDASSSEAESPGGVGGGEAALPHRHLVQPSPTGRSNGGSATRSERGVDRASLGGSSAATYTLRGSPVGGSMDNLNNSFGSGGLSRVRSISATTQVLASRARVVPPIASGGGGVNAMDMARGGREPRGEGGEGAAVGGIESGTTDVGAGARDGGPAQERELNETYSKRDFEQLVRDREHSDDMDDNLGPLDLRRTYSKTDEPSFSSGAAEPSVGGPEVDAWDVSPARRATPTPPGSRGGTPTGTTRGIRSGRSLGRVSPISTTTHVIESLRTAAAGPTEPAPTADVGGLVITGQRPTSSRPLSGRSTSESVGAKASGDVRLAMAARAGRSPHLNRRRTTPAPATSTTTSQYGGHFGFGLHVSSSPYAVQSRSSARGMRGGAKRGGGGASPGKHQPAS